ncbi:hypothetical protein C8046_00985 [Serinibacter arcticus]|uniref:Maltose/maltodextrin ABC transporter, substrate binding periplasmic protein MalE n=1 Tax=Serinibacter arcticus TaxID=1655435 RepID=A0A2U1ZR80_9MICO|nr:hypothetical protein C8046_00985 [Serinibacter arcticus]
MNMRKSTITAVIASAALLLTACGGGGGGTEEEPTTGETTSEEATETETEAAPEGEEGATEAPVRGSEDLVIWTDDVKFDAVQAAAEAFGEANDITVGVQAIVNTRTDFITANQAGNGPDVLVGAHDWIGQLVANGAIDPLQVAPDALSGYAERAVSAVSYNGQLYGIPYGVESLVLYCNTAYAPTPTPRSTTPSPPVRPRRTPAPSSPRSTSRRVSTATRTTCSPCTPPRAGTCSVSRLTAPPTRPTWASARPPVRPPPPSSPRSATPARASCRPPSRATTRSRCSPTVRPPA